jgi:polar amino acid transport system substrate-binding protein
MRALFLVVLLAADQPGSAVPSYVGRLLEGAWVTVYLSVVSFAVAMVLGLVIAVTRLYGPAPLRWAAVVYVDVFRGIPLLLLLFFLYFGLPGVAEQFHGFGMGWTFRMDALTTAILGFGLNYAAYEAEIYRAGISAIPLGQWEAAASLGMSGPQTFWRIIMPQAIRTILPPMTNDFIALFKETSIVSIIAIEELTKRYQMESKKTLDYVGTGLVTASLYLIMAIPLSYLSRYLEKRWGSAHI